jgi:alkylhydroperoxidase/carboxymuconolactone decarboxylase family protein YurZ
MARWINSASISAQDLAGIDAASPRIRALNLLPARCNGRRRVENHPIKGHTKAALRHGASREELMEAIWVAAEMRAGAAYAHSAISLAAMNEVDRPRGG